MAQTPALKTFLWYSSGLPDALRFYKSTFGEGMVVADDVLAASDLFIAEFSIFGHAFVGMNTPGGEPFSTAISLSIQVDGQEEVDRVWNALTTKGEAGRCGWCKDEWGVSWQVVPFQMQEFMSLSDQEKAQQNWQSLMGMGKIQLSEFVK